MLAHQPRTLTRHTSCSACRQRVWFHRADATAWHTQTYAIKDLCLGEDLTGDVTRGTSFGDFGVVVEILSFELMLTLMFCWLFRASLCFIRSFAYVLLRFWVLVVV